jgi:hypothetical protein
VTVLVSAGDLPGTIGAAAVHDQNLPATLHGAKGLDHRVQALRQKPSLVQRRDHH